MFSLFLRWIASELRSGRLSLIFKEVYMLIDRIALLLTIVGALNWGSIGIFSFDLVAWICGGATTIVARIIYTLVAIAGIFCISMLFRQNDEITESQM